MDDAWGTAWTGGSELWRGRPLAAVRLFVRLVTPHVLDRPGQDFAKDGQIDVRCEPDAN